MGEHSTRRKSARSDETGNGASAYGDLLNDPQYRRWIRRGLIALAAGLVLGLIFTDWHVGLAAAVIAAIADAVYASKTSSSVAAWRHIGASERKTERQLQGMARAGYRALHARAIPGSDAQIDHLVVGPTGVYAVDSENWDKRMPLRVQSHRKLFLGPFNQKDRLDEARWEADQAHELISSALGTDIDVRPSLAVFGPRVPWNVLTIRDVDVYTGSRMRKYLKKQDKVLTEEEIDRIYKIANRVLPQRYGDDVEAPN